MVRNRFRKLVCIGACVTTMFAGTLTAHAYSGYTDLDTVTQVTPDGVNVYGTLRINKGAGELMYTGEATMLDIMMGYEPEEYDIPWPDIYLNAIDAAGITNGMSDYDKCVAINNYICNAMTYDDSRDHSNNPAEALAAGTGVCQHYAGAFQIMCTMLHIDSDYITSNEMNHAWNEVHIGGTTYYVDVTWNDTTGQHDRYLMSTTLWSDHYGGKALEQAEYKKSDLNEELIQHGTIGEVRDLTWEKLVAQYGEDVIGPNTCTIDITYNGQSMKHAE